MDQAEFSDKKQVDDFDEFLDEAGPDEHEDWNELASAYYGGVSVTLGTVNNRVFVIWSAMEGTDSGWDEWYGSDDVLTKHRLANKAAEEMAEEYAISYGVPAPRETYGLDNLNVPAVLPLSSIEIGKLLFHFGDLEVISVMKLFETWDKRILVASDEMPNQAIGRYNSLDDVKNSVPKVGPILASFWSADNDYASGWMRWT